MDNKSAKYIRYCSNLCGQFDMLTYRSDYIESCQPSIRYNYEQLCKYEHIITNDGIISNYILLSELYINFDFVKDENLNIEIYELFVNELKLLQKKINNNIITKIKYLDLKVLLMFYVGIYGTDQGFHSIHDKNTRTILRTISRK